MAIAVAAGSPIFSPPMRTHSCNSNQDNFIPQFTASPSSSSPSPYRSRFLKQATGRRISPDFSSTTASTTASVTSLKRKRPARLDIPELQSTSCFGFEAVDEGKRCGGVDEVEADSTRFSVFCKKGKVKQSMDDRYCAGVDICGDSKLAFFGVFDGHGGSKAAEFAASNVEKNVIAAIREEEEEEDEQVSNNQARFEEAVRIAYLRTDSDLLKQEVPGGSCAVTALIMNDDDLVVSNAGDCRAVISKGGVAEAVTSDHRPSREDEKNRIESNGGYVDCIRGIWRLQGTLAVSRGLGDSHLKHWVIADPETTVLKIDSECEFLILASDGLWDKVSNQEAVDTVRSMWVNSSSTSSNNSPPSLLSACKKLADLSVSRGSFDDVAVLVIPLRRFA